MEAVQSVPARSGRRTESAQCSEEGATSGGLSAWTGDAKSLSEPQGVREAREGEGSLGWKEREDGKRVEEGRKKNEGRVGVERAW